MKHNCFTRCLALLLILAAMAGLLSIPAGVEEPPVSETLDGANSVTLKYNSTGLRILNKSTGGTFGGGCYTYTANTGLQGPGYCVNYDLTGVSSSKQLPIHKYDRNPKTMGAITNGYPQRTLEQFKELHPDDIRGIDALTLDEYAYATQVAVWASCGQIAVPGTTFTAGRSSIVEPTADAQQIRVFDSVKAILKLADGWTKHLYSGVYLRAGKDVNIAGVEIIHAEGLSGAAENGSDGVKKETINGIEYYTRTACVASATSPWISGYKISIFSTDAPSGTIFTAENNSALETGTEDGVTSYKVDISAHQTTSFNANGVEYYGVFKVCIPVTAAADEGSFLIRCRGQVAQFQLYLADNASTWEQSYIIADPAYVTLSNSMPFKWSRTDLVPETASLQIVKAGNGGEPLEGAEFTLSGSGGTTVTGTSDRNGQVVWNDLPAGEVYTLVETKAPEGYTVVDPVNITLTAGRTAFVTVNDSTERRFTIKKVDTQNKASIQGAVFRFEQIDGSFVTTGTTDFDGTIEFQGDSLPYGAYRVTEQTPPEGYVKSDRVETVAWDGKKDVLITWENDRDTTIIVEKVDEQTGVSLPGAVFDVFADGEFITSVTTDNAGEARISGIKKEAYIEVVETAAPSGYALDQTPHGIHVVPYDPTIQDDPVLTVTNRARPALRILKYDLTTKSPMPNVTFKLYRDSQPIGQYTTGDNGDIYLYDLPAGTWLVEEIATDDAHVVNSTPQQIKLENGATQTYELVFFNSRKPGISLIKVDSQTLASLPNAKFEFKLVGGSFTKEFTTGIDGLIDLTKLEPGAYEVREVAAPDGYLIDDAVRIVQVNPDEDANFVFTNTRKPKIRLVKKSSDGSPLQGVFFDIKRIEDGTVYENQITDENGEINIPDLEPGVYSVRETATTSNHILDLHEYHVELFPGQTSTISLENQRRPSLIIRKTDKDSGDPIMGVTFTLEGPDGPTITTEPTGPDGTVTIENLLPGVYTVKEQNVPDTYLLDTQPQRITLFPNRTATVQFQNYKRPTLKISKVDVNGKLLTGAIFEVKTKASVKIGDFPVGPDGTITISNVHLSEGYYIITEKQAPSGYILDSTPHEVYLRPGKTTEISIENEKKPGLTIHKVDSVVGDGVKGAKFEIWVSKDKNQNGTYQQLTSSYYYTDENGIIHLDNLDTGWYKIVEVEPPSGFMLKEPSEQIIYVEHDTAVEATFENIPKSALVIRKVDSATGAPLSNAWFRVRYLGGTSGSGGTIIGEYPTSSNGNIVITGLDAGTYVCEEISAPNGYVMDTAPQTAYISGKEQDCITLTYTNSKYGSVLLKKVDSITGEPLSDVQFSITTSDGAVVGNSNGYFTTDSAGTVMVSDIMPGTTLVVKETRTHPGYILDDVPQTVKIESNETKTLEFRNQPTGSLLIRKVCSVNPSVALANAEFKVTYSDGSIIGDSNGIYRSDENGEVRIEGLTPGKSVVITETKAPAGFLIDTQSQTAVIQAGKTVSVTMKNQPTGKLVIQKRDSITNKPLSGAEFRIMTAAGCEVGLDGVIGTSSLTQSGIFVTDSQGEIRISNLAPGAYVINEIKAPDGGYVIDTPSTNVVIGTGGDTQTVVIKDSKAGTLVVEKRDSLTNKPLAGVSFKITTSTGEFVPDANGQISSNGLYLTDRDGKITINGVVGTLVVTETKTIPGYTIDPGEKTQTVVVNPNDTQTLHFYNTPGTTLVLHKYVEGTENEPISGVAFKVIDGSGAVVGPDDGIYYTDKAGEIVLSDIEPGTTVIAREIKTVEGFVLDGTPQKILIKEGEVQNLTFWNKRDCSLTILKQSTDKTPLTGAMFHITDEDGAAIGTNNGRFTTDRNGLITITGLQPGQVIIVTEEKAPDGYIKDATPKTIKIKQGVANSLTFENAKTGCLVVNKRSSVDKKIPLEGVTFKITTTNGKFLPDENGKISSNGLYYTDENGQIILNSVTGSLVVTEVQTIDGYTIHEANRTQTVEVTPDDTQTLYFYNDPLCSLTLKKVDSVSGKPVPNTEFTVKDANGNLIGKYTTGTDGTVTVTGLVPGSAVVVTETKVPSGYVLNSTPQTIVVKNGTGNAVTSGGSSSSSTGSGSGSNIGGGSGSSGGNNLTIENDPTTTLTIQKFVEGTANQPLQGVEFLVTDSSGAVIGPNNGYYYTNKDGRITISDLEPGITITARETKTVAGYILDGTPQSIKIKVGEGQSMTFWNKKAGGLVLTKLDSITKEPLAGVRFKLSYADGTNVDLDGGKISSNGIYTTDSNGQIIVQNVTGTIIATEIETIPGYVIDPNTKSQTVTVNPDDTQYITFYNSPIGGLELIKVSASDKSKRIPNTTFEIRKMDGALIDTVTTDKNGRVHVSLDAGDYYALEIEAGDGFKIDTTPQYFTIRDGQTTTLTVTNAPFSGIMIHKIDSVSGDGIYGVKFLVYDQNKNPIGEYTTDDQGYIYIDDLTVQGKGKLFIRELEAATGYELDKQYKTVYVQPGKTIEIEWENTPITGQEVLCKG